MHGPWRGRPGPGGDQPRHRHSRGASGTGEIGGRRPDDHRTGTEARREVLGGGGRVAGGAEHDDHPSALHADQRVVGRRAGRAAQGVDEVVVGGASSVGATRAHHHGHGGVLAPAEGGDPGVQHVVGLAAQQGVDDQRLEPCVPRPAGLGRAGVDLGRAEGDLAGVAQHGLADGGHLRGVVGVVGHLVDVVLHHLHDGADEVEGLAQAHRPGQLARRGAEHVRGDGERLALVLEPGGEGADAGLRHQPDPRPVLRVEGAVPGQRLLEPLQRRRRQRAGAHRPDASGEGARSGAARRRRPRHGVTLRRGLSHPDKAHRPTHRPSSGGGLLPREARGPRERGGRHVHLASEQSRGGAGSVRSRRPRCRRCRR